MTIAESDIYVYDEKQKGFSLKDGASVTCPDCGAHLKKYGRRCRHFRGSKSEDIAVSIQRMRCTNGACRKIHHLLPEGLLPYKHYLGCCIEKVLSGHPDVIACELSTEQRWKRWFHAVRNGLGMAVTKVTGLIVNGEDLMSMKGHKHDWLRFAVQCRLCA